MYCGRRERDVHRELARELRGAALELHERRRSCSPAGGRTRASVPPSKRCRVDDDDVLAELGDQLGPLALERLDGLRAVRVDAPAAPSRRTPGTRRSSRRARSRSRSRRSTRRSASTITPTRPSLVARSARLPAAAMPFSRRSVARGLEVAAGLLQRLLAGHHPRAGLVAELLDEARADLGHAAHACSPFDRDGLAAGSASAAAAAPRRRLAAASASGSAGCSAGSPRRRAGCAPPGGELGLGDLRLRRRRSRRRPRGSRASTSGSRRRSRGRRTSPRPGRSSCRRARSRAGRAAAPRAARAAPCAGRR